MPRGHAGRPMQHGAGRVMVDGLRHIMAENRLRGCAAIPPVFSAHRDLGLPSLPLSDEPGRPVVMKATSDQFNQEGGYTGLHPFGFVALVRGMADAAGCAPGHVRSSGDHLGPQAWRKGDAPPATIPSAAQATVAVQVAGFNAAGIGDTAAQFDALVVQPGVEFSHTRVHHPVVLRNTGDSPMLAHGFARCRKAHATDCPQPAAFQKVTPPLLTPATALSMRWKASARSGTPPPGPGRDGAVDAANCRLLAGAPPWQQRRPAMQHCFALADRVRHCWPHAQALRAATALLADLAARPLPDAMWALDFVPNVTARAHTPGGPLPTALHPCFIDSPGAMMIKEAAQ